MKILALDPATTTGFAHNSGPSGTWDLSVRPDESKGMRLIRLRAKLDEILSSVGIDLVVYEAARNLKHGNAVRVNAELIGTLQVWCIDNEIEYKGFSATEIKKFATGKGNANKNGMVDAAEKIIGRPLQDGEHDEADAILLLHLAKKEYDA